jgi:hypothetical protein
MILYHGGIVHIKYPDLLHSRNNLDFGPGFYLTKLKPQAVSWAKRKARITGGQGIVGEYNFDADELELLVLNGYSKAWLDFIVQNRTDNLASISAFDAIEGQVADDDIINEVNAYIALLKQGKVTSKTTDYYLELFSYANENHQICARTDRALGGLEFVKGFEV